MLRIHVQVAAPGEDARAALTAAFSRAPFALDIVFVHAADVLSGSKPPGELDAHIRSEARRHIRPGGCWSAALQSAAFSANCAASVPSARPEFAAAEGAPPPREKMRTPFWRGANMSPGVLSRCTIEEVVDYMEGHPAPPGQERGPAEPQRTGGLHAPGAEGPSCAPRAEKIVNPPSAGSFPGGDTAPEVASAVNAVAAHIKSHLGGSPSFGAGCGSAPKKQKNFVQSVYGYDRPLSDAAVRAVCEELGRLGY